MKIEVNQFQTVSNDRYSWIKGVREAVDIIQTYQIYDHKSHKREGKDKMQKVRAKPI